MLLKTFLSLLLATIICSSQASAFSFTAIPDQDTASLQNRFNKIADYLSTQLGIKVTYIPVKSYAASVAAFKNNQVQLAWFGGLSGVKARQAVPGSRAIAQGEEDLQFKTYFIAGSTSGLQPSDTLKEDIAGLTFTFGSKGSTSGRLMPEYYLRKQFGKSPDQLFKRVGYSGDHSKTIALVQSGAYQLGAVNFKVWEKELKEGKVDPEKVQVIWTTPEYPDYNWTIRADVDSEYGQGFAEKVQEALLSMNDPDLLASFPRSGFIKANNTMYQPIVETGEAIGILRK